jgi:hypothetical protein
MIGDGILNPQLVKIPAIARPIYPLQGIFSALSLNGDNHYQPLNEGLM